MVSAAVVEKAVLVVLFLIVSHYHYFLSTQKFPAFVYVTPETTPFYMGGNRARKGFSKWPTIHHKSGRFRV